MPPPKRTERNLTEEGILLIVADTCYIGFVESNFRTPPVTFPSFVSLGAKPVLTARIFLKLITRSHVSSD